jgi:hypothetical protein
MFAAELLNRVGHAALKFLIQVAVLALVLSVVLNTLFGKASKKTGAK